MDEYNLNIDAIDDAFEGMADAEYNSTYNSIHGRHDAGVHENTDWLENDEDELDLDDIV